VAEVVPTHFVKSLLRTEDVIYEVEHNETVVYGIDYVVDHCLGLRGAFSSEEIGVQIQNHFLEIKTVKRHNVMLHVFFFGTFYLDLDQLFLNPPSFLAFNFFLRRTLPNPLLDLLHKKIIEILIASLPRNCMPNRQSLNPLHYTLRMNLLPINLYKLMFFLHPFFTLSLLDIVDVNIDVISDIVMNVYVNVYVLTLGVSLQIA
jgi:hypothetical protein